MTDREANAEAARRWGSSGVAWHHCYGRPTDYDFCRVGLAIGEVRDVWFPYGKGRDWAEAFLDAARKGY